MPAVRNGQRAAEERRKKRADIDSDVENRVAAVAPVIARRIESTDLARNVRLEGSDAEDQEQQRHQEQRLESHHKMADCHQRATDENGPPYSEQPVGAEPT